ncbi:hypothetical protein OIU84_027423 [Salix udensis]|uniref:Late embryogenesis abundant protein n=1 Tax=Salix udensis TaxID=889485 RepID=A0AAD6PBI0_9ROSI|nr:hypothetical protein OIU84_027423 [Salix udensis]
MEHGAKDKAENLYEEAKNTASEKAHEAKGWVEDVYEKAREKTAEKAQDGKECAQESLNKVKNTVKEAKDSGKTIMSAWEEELKCPGGSTGVSSAGVGERVPCCGVHVVSKVLASRLARLQKEATCAEIGSCVNQKGND